jgi:superfamily II DNA or RNA helicase
MVAKPKISFELGTLIVQGLSKETTDALAFTDLKFDARTLQWRCPAYRYREIVSHCYEQKLPLTDRARAYQRMPIELRESIEPRAHQAAALDAWLKSGGQGVVSLPTGAGKTFLAVLCLAKIQRPTLIVVPTIDLLSQWKGILERFFPVPIGAYGGGYKDLQDVTVATYDSAHLIVESVGDRFGCLIFDECHHLPSPQYQWIAQAAIAPFRLGLSATVERSDGKEELIFQLLGDLVYQGQIGDMVADVLSPYDVVSLQVPLTDEEQHQYKAARDIYTRFVRQQRIALSSPGGWQEFIRKAASVPGGREAMRAYREQKRLAQASAAKLVELWKILNQHVGERVIIFTSDNALAYRIGRKFFLPVLTHQTKAKERKKMLEAFRQGQLEVLVTSKVLNEGVDVPEASVGVVVSGSGAVREHVQRLGRILRHRSGKRAVLYELVAKNTAEYYVNQRRRMHHAYQRPSQVHRSR